MALDEETVGSEAQRSGAATQTASDATARPLEAGPRRKPAGVSVFALQERIDSLGVDAVAVRDERYLPQKVRESLLRRGLQTGPKGLFDPSTNCIYVVASNLNSLDEAEREVVYHEAFHRGLRKTFGPEVEPVLQYLYDANEALRFRSHQYMLAYQIDRMEAIEEALAELAHRAQARHLSGWDRLVNLIKSWFARKGSVQPLSNDDVEKIVAGSVRAGLREDVGPRPQTELKSFRRWFGQSVVVESDGSPKRVYHGTGSEDAILDDGFVITYQRPNGSFHGDGFYFSDQRTTAAHYASVRAEELGESRANKSVLDVYLAIHNPIEVDARHAQDRVHGTDGWPDLTLIQAEALIRLSPEFDDPWGPLSNFGEATTPAQKQALISQVARLYAGGHPLTLRNDFYPNEPAAWHRAFQRVTGYDGVRIRVTADETHYVAWFPEQIKSASLNTGAFSPESRNIRLRTGDDALPPVVAAPALASKPTAHLSNQQSAELRAAALRKWFGNSTVRNAAGEPLVVYHATHAPEDFSRFRRRLGDIGVHFGTLGQALSRAQYLATRGKQGEELAEVQSYLPGSRLLPVYIKLERPLRLPDLGSWNADNLGTYLVEAGVLTSLQLLDINRRHRHANARLAAMRDAIEARGYDGIVYRNTGETAGSFESMRRVDVARAELNRSQLARGKSLMCFDAEDRATPAYQSFLVAETAAELFRQTHAEDSYIVFRPNQVKSAIGNRGTFDSKLADIRFSRAQPVAAQVSSPAFRAWFGASKVVSKSGAPLIMYHGTKSDFSAFDLRASGASDPGLGGRGFYFTYSPEEASGYALNEQFGNGESPNLRAVYVSVANPLVITAGVLPDGRQLMDLHGGVSITAEGGALLRKLADAGGHDGVIWASREGEVRHVLAFRPEQVKSAFGNRGTFEATSTNILFQRGGFARLTTEGPELAAGGLLTRPDGGFATFRPSVELNHAETVPAALSSADQRAQFQVDGGSVKTVSAVEFASAPPEEIDDAFHIVALVNAMQMGVEDALARQQAIVDALGDAGAKVKSPLAQQAIRVLRDLRRLVGRTVALRPSFEGAGALLRPSAINPGARYEVYETVHPAGSPDEVAIRLSNPAYLHPAVFDEVSERGELARSRLLQYLAGQGFDGLVVAESPRDLAEGGWYGAAKVVPFGSLQVLPASIVNAANAAAVEQQLRKQQIESVAFRQWFGQSQFIDRATGEPLMFWRGESQGGDFRTFDRNKTRESAFFFTTNEGLAREYAGGTDPRAFYLRAERVLDLSRDTPEARAFVADWAKAWEGEGWVDRASGEPIDPFDAVISGGLFDYEGDWSSRRWRDLQASIEAAGFDGAILPDHFESFEAGGEAHPRVAYIVFSPDQIKSAERNAGTFRRDTNDIYLSRQSPLSSPYAALNEAATEVAGASTAADGPVAAARTQLELAQVAERQLRLLHLNRRATDTAIVEAAQKSQQARAQFVSVLAAQPADAFFVGRSLRGFQVTLGQSAQTAGFFQVTRFDRAGEPLNDSQYTDRNKALQDFITEVSPSTVEVLTSDGVDITSSQAPAPFDAWFDGSKVIDESGRPLVVYHGTGADTGESFLAGTYFTPSLRLAELFARAPTRQSPEAGPNIVPVYLAIKNPYVYDARQTAVSFLQTVLGKRGSLAQAIAALKDKGFDGVLLRNYPDIAGEQDQYIVFSPEQVRSAVGAAPQPNPSVYLQRGGVSQPDPRQAALIDQFVEAGEVLVGYRRSNPRQQLVCTRSTQGGAFQITYFADGVSTSRQEFQDVVGAVSAFLSDDIEVSAGAAQRAEARLFVPPTSAVEQQPAATGATMEAEFAKWFGQSKVVADDGSPKLVYHGTYDEFDQFDGDEIFFAEDPATADDYGPRLVRAHLSIQNPLRYEYNDGPSLSREEAIAAGYDGYEVIGHDVGEGDTIFANKGSVWVAFYPSQVRRVRDTNQVLFSRGLDGVNGGIAELASESPPVERRLGVSDEALGASRGFLQLDGGVTPEETAAWRASVLMSHNRWQADPTREQATAFALAIARSPGEPVFLTGLGRHGGLVELRPVARRASDAYAWEVRHHAGSLSESLEDLLPHERGVQRFASLFDAALAFTSNTLPVTVDGIESLGRQAARRSRLDAAYEELRERLDSEQALALEEFALSDQTDAGKSAPSMAWPLVPAGLLKRVWREYIKTGRVDDEVALKRIERSMLGSYARLELATALAGHTEHEPVQFIEKLAPALADLVADDAALLERLVDWVVAPPEGSPSASWRISDYALEPLGEGLLAALSSRTPAERLKHLDRMLNIVHMRSDLASLFVEGGTATLTAIACGESASEAAPGVAPAGLVDEGAQPREKTAFSQWFDGSKIVEPDGGPLVCFHRTGLDADFTVFNSHSPATVYLLDGETEIQRADSWDLGPDAKGAPEAYHYMALSDAISIGVEAALQVRGEDAKRHGTNPDVERLLADLGRLRGCSVSATTKNKPSGGGFYFSPDRDYCFMRKEGDGAVMPVYLNIKNPVWLNGAQIESAGMAHKVKEWMAQGYDGAIYAPFPEDLTRSYGDGYRTQIVAFRPNQIKSVFGNVGAFNPDSDDIRFSRGEVSCDDALEGNSSLQEHPLTRDHAFEDWYRDSALRTSSGAPIVLYHGTPTRPSESNNRYIRDAAWETGDREYAGFTSFAFGSGSTDSGWYGRGAYFTPDPDYAEEFGNFIMPVYVRLLKPFEIVDEGAASTSNCFRFLQSLQSLNGLEPQFKLDLSVPQSIELGPECRPMKRYFTTVVDRDGQVLLLSSHEPFSGGRLSGCVEGRGKTVEEAVFDYRYKSTGTHSGFLLHMIVRYGAEAFTKLLKANGYDGVVVSRPKRAQANGCDVAGSDICEVVAFYPEQIKSAVGNRGTYSQASPDILLKRGSVASRGPRLG